jgi:ribosomal protein L11 methyltransferase
VWESQYEPVLIDNRCMVRAPFHPQPVGVEFDIVIMPKMSFGTAHHETTKLMIQYLLSLQVSGKSLLDMGSGTAVLAILARMKGAFPVSAVDNDEWAFNNAVENVKSNKFADIEVVLGDSSFLSDKKFDIILANINRNILLNDIPSYCKSLNVGGKLFMSGFYSEDLPLIEAKANETGLRIMSSRIENKWTAACFTL